MYAFQSKIRYSECDEQGNLSLLGLVNYLQDCSTFHSEEIGRGLAYMYEHQQAWFISAWQIQIHELPRFGDTITISTWCYDLTRAQAMRNFVVANSDGTPCIQADSRWFVFDTKAQRPVRIPDEQRAFLESEPRLDMPPMQRKVCIDGAETEGASLIVGAQHLDTNKHVNNAQYVQMALDALEAHDRKAISYLPGSLQVQYKSMALLGDTVVPYIHMTDDVATIDLTDGHGNSYAAVRLQKGL